MAYNREWDHGKGSWDEGGYDQDGGWHDSENNYHREGRKRKWDSVRGLYISTVIHIYNHGHL